MLRLAKALFLLFVCEILSLQSLFLNRKCIGASVYIKKSANSDIYRRVGNNRITLSIFAQNDDTSDRLKLEVALLNAKKNIESKLSPGGGLNTAEEQAEAAYADLIYTSMEMSGTEYRNSTMLESLAKGGTMWEDDSKRENKNGLLGDLKNAFEALIGGAHIVKNKYGQT